MFESQSKNDYEVENSNNRKETVKLNHEINRSDNRAEN